MSKMLLNAASLTIVSVFLIAGCAGHRQAKELSIELDKSSDIALSYAREIRENDKTQTEIFNRAVQSYGKLLQNSAVQIRASADAHARAEYQRAKLQIERDYWVARNEIDQSIEQTIVSLSASVDEAFAPLREETANFEARATTAKSEADAHPGDQTLRAAYGRAAAEYLARYSQLVDDKNKVMQRAQQEILKLQKQWNLRFTSVNFLAKP